MYMDLIKQGFEVAFLGLGGVFLVLILFYLCTKLMLKIFTKKDS